MVILSIKPQLFDLLPRLIQNRNEAVQGTAARCGVAGPLVSDSAVSRRLNAAPSGKSGTATSNNSSFEQ
jgi:hypothetical protein